MKRSIARRRLHMGCGEGLMARVTHPGVVLVPLRPSTADKRAAPTSGKDKR